MSGTGLNIAAIAALAKAINAPNGDTTDLENFLVAATPGGIVAQEKAGQASLAGTVKRLPQSIMGRATREALTAAWGVQFGENVDELFVAVDFPDGWKVVPTTHDMWSDLIAPDGTKRGGIFYKAAFYDRKADLSVFSRYIVHTEYGSYEDRSIPNVLSLRDEKTGTTIEVIGSYARNDYDENDKVDKAARERLTALKPDWKNPLAYWDEA